MDENKNADFKSNSNSSENSNSRLGLTRPASNNSIPRPGPSNSNRPSTSSNHWQERDRKPAKKRSHSENNDWDRDSKLNKREIPDNMKKDGNCEKDKNETSNENSNDIPIMSLHDIAIESQKRAVASMSQQQMAVAIPQQSQQQMTVAIPQQPQQQIMHQAISYQSYGYNASENYHMDPSQGAYPLNPFSAILPINSQWPLSNVMPAAASSTSSSGMGISNGMDMVSSANGSINVYPYTNMPNCDASLYGMMTPGMPVFSSFLATNHVETVVPMFNIREPITIPHAVLTPPPPNETRSRRSKPNGCRTVYVGGLPEKITEEIIRDAFQICGPIFTIRRNPKSFCHIRFESMESVDQAILLSGFRIRIDESEDSAFNSTLHVDYATARDDDRDYQCLERARLREERHRQQEVYRPPSPPPIPHYSEHEAQLLAEKLRKEETLKDGLQELITWLDRGECNKKNSGRFYSLIQASHNHVKRLRSEKIRYEEEAQKAKEDSIKKNRAIGCQLTEIEKVFTAAKTQKVWDHFTKTQRKKMEEMKNDTLDLKESNSVDLLDVRKEEMDLSDTEDSNDNAEELSVLREKNNTLTEELDATYQSLEDCKANCAEHQDEIVKLRLELEECKKIIKASNDSPTSFDDQLSVSDSATQCSTSTVDATENDSQLMCLISIFLHVHPFGASIDYICSYLVKIVPSINARDVESLLRRFPNLFKEVCTGIGASLEKKWTYIGFRY